MSNVIPIWPELPKQLSREDAAKLVAEVLADSANVQWSDHVLERMYERDITDMQVLQVMRRGTVVTDPKFGSYRNWEVSMEAHTAGDHVRVGLAIDANKLGFYVVVITTIHL